MSGVFLIVVLCCFLTGLAKGGLGQALGSLVTPLLALVLPAPLAVGLTLPIFVVGDVFAAAAHWRGWDTRILLAVLPGSILGVIVGSLTLGQLPPATLQHGLGVVALLYVAYRLWDRRHAKVQTDSGPSQTASHLYGAGSAFASTVANAGGPSFTIYMLLWKRTPAIFVGTMALYFAMLNALKIPGYLVSGTLSPERILLVVWALPFVPFGVWSGLLLDKRIDMATFERLVLFLLAFSGVILILK